MPRETKARQTARPAKNARGGSTLLGLFLGILIGVLIALAVAWYINRTPVPFLDGKKTETPQKPAVRSYSAEPAPLPGKPGDKPVEKPRFDFYKMLPEGDGATPPATSATQVPPAAPQNDNAPRVATPEKVFLQVGAFQKPSDADNLKAKLALMGLEASVRQAEVPEKGVVHRVLVGPYTSPDEFNAARNQLMQAGIPSSVVRNKN